MAVLSNFPLSLVETITLRPTTAFNKAAADQLSYNIDAHLTPDLIAQGQGAISGGHVKIDLDQLENDLHHLEQQLDAHFSEIETYDFVIKHPKENDYHIPETLSCLIPFIQESIDHHHTHSPFAKEKFTTLTLSYKKHIDRNTQFNGAEWHIHTIDSAESVFRTLPNITPRLEWDHF